MLLDFVIPQTGLPVWGSYSFQRVASLGRMILPLCPGLRSTLGALGCMLLHLSPTCLPHLSPTLGGLGRMILHLSSTLVFHSGCSGPHEFTRVSHLSPTPGALGRVILHVSPTCLSHLGAILNALDRIILHLSPTCSHVWRNICCY